MTQHHDEWHDFDDLASVGDRPFEDDGAGRGSPTSPSIDMPHVRGAKQLDLFDHVPGAGAAAGDRGSGQTAIADGPMDRTHARASVPPGWWPILEPYFRPSSIIAIRACREVDGRLHLDGMVRAGYQISDADVASALARLREIAERTCGSCGAQPARPRCRHVDGPVHVACDACWARIKRDETPAAIADQHFRFDGSRRPTGTALASRVPASTRPAASTGNPAGRTCTTLPPDELRETIAAIRERMARDVPGQDHAVGILSLIAGVHVGGGLDRGARALLLGPSGVGKSTILSVLIRSLADLGWDLASVVCECGAITSPGWSGAPSIGDLLDAAFAGDDPDGPRARNAIVVLDELHHVGMTPTGMTGNMLEARRERVASLLPLTGYGGRIQLGGSTRQWSSDRALVVGCGAYTDLLPDLTRDPTTKELVAAGLPLELATRFQTVVRLRSLPERALIELLRRWPELVQQIELCRRLGYEVHIHPEAYSRAARVVTLGLDGSTARTAGSWLVAALQQALLEALKDPRRRKLAIAPDSLSIPSTATRRVTHEDDDRDDDDGPEATVIVIAR